MHRRPLFVSILLFVLACLAVAFAQPMPSAAQSNLPLDRPTIAPQPTRGPTRPPLTPVRRSKRDSSERSANVCLRLLANPNKTVAPGEITAYQLVAQNKGWGQAASVDLHMPFDSSVQTLLDAAFTSSSAWVNSINPDYADIRLGALDPAEVVTATMRLRVNPNTKVGHTLTMQSTFTWNDAAGGGMGRSNVSSIFVTNARADATTESLNIVPFEGGHITTFTITYNGMAGNERVSRWYHDATGHVVALDELQADSEGHVVFELTGAMLPVGRTTFVAHGQCSQVTATGTFTVTDR